jgi:glucose/arabinose dehydrogenase
MLRATAVWVGLISAVALAGCENRPPPTPSPGPGGGETITGSERLGWNQTADDGADLATFRFAAYVDGARSEIADVTCGATAGASGFACSGRLPAMGAGSHTLELSAFRRDQPSIESPRSASLRVTVTAVAPGDGDGRQWADGEAGITSDGVPLFVQRLAGGLDRPADAVFDRDGRLFIAERTGRVVIFDEGRLAAWPSLSDTAPGTDLLALALDPDFADTRFVYTLSVAGPPGRGRVFRLSRYRELRGVLAERAVLLETAAPAQPDGSVRFGPDGKLYLALGAAVDDDPSSYLGKVLRLNADGTSPRDSRGALPVFAGGFIAPRALAWHPGGSALWIADGVEEGPEWITGVGATDSSPPRAAWGMPPSEVSSSLAFYPGDRIPEFRGELLVGSANARRILRVRFDTADPLTVVSTEPMLEDRVGPIHVVLAGPDGGVYFCTETDLGRVVAGERR